MTVQVLVATMYQRDYSLLDIMNIQTDAIVINQCDVDSVERFYHRGHSILWISMKERGVGLSRNTALMRATGDILLFADDDVRYSDGYAEVVARYFKDNQNCDFAVFNLESQNSDREEKIITKDYRLHWYNSLKFGTFRLAVRRNAIRNTRICFSLLFGGGAIYQNGEDSLFIEDCLRGKLKGYASSQHIGTVLQNTSTWFSGYDEAYFHDRGVFMKHAFGIWSYPLAIALILKNPEQYRMVGFVNACRYAISGIRTKE